MKQPLCLGTLTSGEGKPQHWIPENEPDPAAEVKAGDLYLLTGPPPSPPPPQTAREVSTSAGGKRKGVGGRAPVRYPVRVTVYRSSYGHYAVLTASLLAPATYLNLRTCRCQPCTPSSSPSSLSPTTTPVTTTTTTTTTFRVELGGGEGRVVYFEVPSKDRGDGGVEEWVGAFQGAAGGGGVPPSPGSISPSLSPLIPRSPIMPTLQESLEEEEEEEEISGLG